MNALAALIVPEPLLRDDAEEVVERVFAPYSEHDYEDGWWDWWQIGGRWTGVWGEYDPNLDPANIETCFLCHGTGTRTDMVVANGCNHCGGKGAAVAWPTAWKPYDGDVVPVTFILGSLDKEGFHCPYRFVTTTETRERERYVPDAPQGERFQVRPEYEAEFRAALEANRGGSVIVVDYHS